ncbi:Endoribonuclease YbeY [Capnocytophaga canimorsus]|uniref:Endoribonuclease YbeY n=1 Tax=Capnocytophaga canimorsus TaxID=28188 RepID=A0A0B7HW59_9FLAO|nr:rRNA maturation RNase YbeY [Capnocytophaga canimorsus]ATA77221.1 rRNA maturation RNase YbeY [Capnocytophaga canimorsus]PJI83621.1 rRNA maturation RNase YbeY [Capnocytophaga canimorsus]CEN41718.1 Endoribonuclease YbeY [Capnocytophaga canimorsus]STA72455.1 Probable rRNA maturation factor [Capnocytophaga canimorsus]
MITFNYEIEFELPEQETVFQAWIEKIIASEQKELGELNYIFCDDNYLHQINVQYLDHDTLTDIITFDYTQEQTISGDIFISVERVADNAQDFNVDFQTELLRVMAHGVLHLCGYKDKSDAESKQMRSKEEEKMRLF